MNEIVGQVFGLLVMVGCVVSSQFPKRWQILLGYAFVNLFSAFNQLLVGAGLTACFLCIVATVHCAVNSGKAKKEIPELFWEKALFIALYFVAWVAGFAVSFRNGTPFYLDLMTLIATLFFLGQVLLPRERDIRLCVLGNSLVYFLYDSINFNVAAVAKLFNILSVIVALIRYRKKDSV